MLYQIYEFNHALISPARATSQLWRLYYNNPLNPLSYTDAGKKMAAMCQIFERITQRYGKPDFSINEIQSHGHKIKIQERIVWEQDFCRLIHFSKNLKKGAQAGPKLLIVAPLSGHYATLLRGTVEALLIDHDVYITDWANARMVPQIMGEFNLDDYIDYVISMLHTLGPLTHVMAVCQPAVPVFSAVALMEAQGDKLAPVTMTLIGGPIDTRKNPTVVNQLTKKRGIEWFRSNTVKTVPFPYPGIMRKVYPGFMQLTGFMSMNFDRHMSAHKNLFDHLVQGDEDSVEKHLVFYDEYLAVMDLTAEFYLQTVETVFIRHDLPKLSMTHRGTLVDPRQVRNTALLTIEGELDDISGVGQTEAAHGLCVNLPDDMHQHYLQKNVGHYGTFNGSRFKHDIVPRIRDFIAHFEKQKTKNKTPKVL